MSDFELRDGSRRRSKGYQTKSHWDLPLDKHLESFDDQLHVVRASEVHRSDNIMRITPHSRELARVHGLEILLMVSMPHKHRIEGGSLLPRGRPAMIGILYPFLGRSSR